MKRKKILFIERVLPHYRVSFFNQLKESLDKIGFDLLFIYGQSNSKEQLRKDNSEIKEKWAIKIENIYLPFGLLWQPVFKYLKDVDIVIFEQALKSLSNNFIFILKNKSTKSIFFSHGRNYQKRKGSIFNYAKKMQNIFIDWWICYTESGKKHLESIRFDPNRITVVNNTLDTKLIQKNIKEITKEDISYGKRKFGLGNGPIGIYCGGMYKEKRIPFLVDAVKLIKKEITSFEMIFIGSGVEGKTVEDAAAQNHWIHYVGTKTGKEKLILFKNADIFLLPGAVGLAILDSFVLQVPLITTKYPFHGPEIDYLDNNINGIITEDTVSIFSSIAIKTLQSPEMLARLKKQCALSVEKYTLEKMIDNFTNGIINCMNYK